MACQLGSFVITDDNSVRLADYVQDSLLFTKQIQLLFKTDEKWEIIAKIRELMSDRLETLEGKATESMTFHDQVMAVLGNPDDAIAEIERLRAFHMNVVFLFEKPVDVLHEIIRLQNLEARDLNELKHWLISFTTYLGIPRESEAHDIANEIISVKGGLKACLEREENLQNELRTAKKVIARLVGE